MWDSALRGRGGGVISALQEFFAGINKTFILVVGLGTGLSFYGNWTLS